MKPDGIIRTEFLAGQGLGNQLWVYAAGRAIAENSNKIHVVTGYDNFLAKEFIEIDICDDYDASSEVQIFNEAIYYDEDLDFFSSSYDDGVEKLPERVHLNGLFQSEKYFYGMIGEISKWMRYSEALLAEAANYSDKYIINLRGGEYKRHKKLILPIEYWNKSIEHIGNICSVAPNELVVVTDDARYARALFPHNEIVSGDIMRCYAALVGCKGAVISNSSFAYFPLKCRQDKPTVIAPALWSRYANDLNRWIMPANYYSDWLYMDSGGIIIDEINAKQLVENTTEFYKNHYKVLISNNLSAKLSRKRYTWIPRRLKNLLKNFLSYLFPKEIG